MINLFLLIEFNKIIINHMRDFTYCLDRDSTSPTLPLTFLPKELVILRNLWNYSIVLSQKSTETKYPRLNFHNLKVSQTILSHKIQFLPPHSSANTYFRLKYCIFPFHIIILITQINNSFFNTFTSLATSFDMAMIFYSQFT